MSLDAKLNYVSQVLLLRACTTYSINLYTRCQTVFYCFCFPPLRVWFVFCQQLSQQKFQTCCELGRRRWPPHRGQVHNMFIRQRSVCNDKLTIINIHRWTVFSPAHASGAKTVCSPVKFRQNDRPFSRS
jgi:hypothetical protein